jgi:hypothetical protein
MHGIIKTINTMHCKYENTDFIKVQVVIDSMDSFEKIEVRRVQALQGERSFTLVFPKDFATQLGVAKGDFLKCHLDGKRLIVERMEP